MKQERDKEGQKSLFLKHQQTESLRKGKEREAGTLPHLQGPRASRVRVGVSRGQLLLLILLWQRKGVLILIRAYPT